MTCGPPLPILAGVRITSVFLILGLLLALSLPVMFITTNVRIAFQSQAMYTYAIDAFDAPRRTGVERDELVRGTAELIEYFASDEDLITTEIDVYGIREPLFTDREAIHFRDVRDLLNRVYALQGILTVVALAVVIAAVVAGARGRYDLTAIILTRVRQSAIGTVIALAAIGIFAAFGGFNALFLQFHLISFSNDLWQALPTDRMILLFPEVFFLQATLLIGVATIAEMAILWVGATLSLRRIGTWAESGDAAIDGGTPTPTDI